MAYDDEPTPLRAEPSIRTRRRKWPWVVLGTLLLVPAAVFALWALITLNYTYSSGDRVGYVLKLSEKGWLCKTWEGELSMQPLPGTVAEKFPFTIRSDSIAHVVQRLQAQQVRLFYEQHKGVPSSCFGESQYFVSRVEPVALPGAAPAPPAPTQAPVGTPAPAPAPTPAPTTPR
jgi:hypothetical protein